MRSSRSMAAGLAGGAWTAPTTSMPAVDQAYQLPSLEELIDAELEMNPGREVLGSASHDAIDGDAQVRDIKVRWSDPSSSRTAAVSDGEVYVDCLGPSSVTVTSGFRSVTNPCLTTGASVVLVRPGDPVVVSASGDTACASSSTGDSRGVQSRCSPSQRARMRSRRAVTALARAAWRGSSQSFAAASTR
jgi:hypothetical protein